MGTAQQTLEQKRRDIIAAVVAKIKASRRKRPDIVIPNENKTHDRYGRPISIDAVIKETPEKLSYLRNPNSPRIASLDAQRLGLYNFPNFHLETHEPVTFSASAPLPKIASPSRTGTQKQQIKSYAREEVPNVHLHRFDREHRAAFSSSRARFIEREAEPEPTHSQPTPVEYRVPQYSFAHSPRFMGYGVAGSEGNGAFDQMYNVDNTAITKMLALNPLKYTMKTKGPRFSTNKAVEKNTFRAPLVKSEVSDALGPGTYDPPGPTIRIRSASRKSSMFSSATPRFSVPHWGNSTPREHISPPRDRTDYRHDNPPPRPGPVPAAPISTAGQTTSAAELIPAKNTPIATAGAAGTNNARSPRAGRRTAPAAAAAAASSSSLSSPSAKTAAQSMRDKSPPKQRPAVRVPQPAAQ